MSLIFTFFLLMVMSKGYSAFVVVDLTMLNTFGKTESESRDSWDIHVKLYPSLVFAHGPLRLHTAVHSLGGLASPDTII